MDKLTLAQQLQVSKFANDIQDAIIDIIVRDFDILSLTTKDKVSSEVLKMHLKKQIDTQCHGINKNNSRCSRTSCFGKYCKIHYNMQKPVLFSSKQMEYKADNIELIHDNIRDNCPKLDINMLKKILIDDTFYLTDDHFIYDKKTHNKVGYKKDDEYIFVDDPFELHYQ